MPISNMKSFDYPVFATQEGGLVRKEGDRYVFIDKPPHHEFNVGDKMPKEWSVIPFNELAHQEVDGSREFQRGLDEFFDIAFRRVENGQLSLGEMREFFPQEVRNRNR